MAEFRRFWNGLLSFETGFTKIDRYFLPLLQDCTSERLRLALLVLSGWVPEALGRDSHGARCERSERLVLC